MKAFRYLLALLGAVAGLALVASPASACSTVAGSHCYSVAIGWANTSSHENTGATAIVCSRVLSVSNPFHDFVTNELWENTPDTHYWIEAGLMYGVMQGSPIYTTPHLFWAAQNSKYGWTFHGGPAASLGSLYKVSITTGSNTWRVQIGTSSNPTAYVDTTGWQSYTQGGVIDAGTEFTADDAAEVGADYSLGWLSPDFWSWQYGLVATNTLVNGGSSGTWYGGTGAAWLSHTSGRAYAGC